MIARQDRKMEIMSNMLVASILIPKQAHANYGPRGSYMPLNPDRQT